MARMVSSLLGGAVLGPRTSVPNRHKLKQLSDEHISLALCGALPGVPLAPQNQNGLKGNVLRDSDGLVGAVRVRGDGTPWVHFPYEFKRDGRKAWHYCGSWPATSLEAIRRARDEARETLKRGLDPNAKREADRIEAREQVKATLAAEARRRSEDVPVSELYAAWLRDGVRRKDGDAEIKRAFDKDVIPSLGAKPVPSVTEHDVRTLLRAVVYRGVNRMAVRLHHDVKQMFAWAEKRQPWRRLMQEGNPADLIEIDKVVSPEYDISNIRERTLDADEIRELRDIFARMKAEHEDQLDKRSGARPVAAETQAALWICLSTACRIGELLMAEWRHVDLDAGVWFIPKENVKGPNAAARVAGSSAPPAAWLAARCCATSSAMMAAYCWSSVARTSDSGRQQISARHHRPPTDEHPRPAAASPPTLASLWFADQRRGPGAPASRTRCSAAVAAEAVLETSAASPPISWLSSSEASSV